MKVTKSIRAFIMLAVAFLWGCAPTEEERKEQEEIEKNKPSLSIQPMGPLTEPETGLTLLQANVLMSKTIEEDVTVKYNIQPDKRSQNTQEQAQIWISETKKVRKQSRTRKPEKQQKQLLQMKSIIQLIRQSLSRRAISRKEALSLASSTKISKIKLACHYFQQDADKAIKNQDPQAASLALKKIKALLLKVDPLPSSLKNRLVSCNELLAQQHEIVKQSKPSSTKRLEEEFDKQEEIDQDWQKKQLYDP